MHGEIETGESGWLKPRAMVLSVGGTAAPIIVSLNRQQPELVCFFVSARSRPSLDTEILPGLGYRLRHYDWIETESAEDMLACYEVLARDLPRIAEKWEVPLAEFVADYTGGTKTMSVALALATVQVVGRYTYVGGTERTKDGLGIVVDGKERTFHQINPWDALAVKARQRASLLFDRCRYDAAAEELEGVAGRVSPAQRTLYQALAELARGYAAWDRFDHARAQALLFKGLQALEPFALGSLEVAWKALVASVREHGEFLRRLQSDAGGPLRLADLVANARRRGEVEARYDDAVARLYSALEMGARLALRDRYDIRTSSVSLHQVPPPLREEFSRKYSAEAKDGGQYLKLPQYAARRLLAELGDELGARYAAREREISGLLDQRNASILAHGDRAVGEKAYRGFLPLVCEVLGIRSEDLPRFPSLPA